MAIASFGLLGRTSFLRFSAGNFPAGPARRQTIRTKRRNPELLTTSVYLFGVLRAHRILTTATICNVRVGVHHQIVLFRKHLNVDLLSKRLDPVEGGRRLANYLRVLTLEAQTLARACGKNDMRNLEPEDLVALTVESAAMARVPLAGTNWIPGQQQF